MLAPVIAAVALAGLPLKTVQDVPLTGGSSRFDYESLDPSTNRLYVSHLGAGQLLVFDVRTRRIVRTIAAPGVHGVLAVPAVHRVYASATDAREVLTIDARTGRVLARAPAGEYPDGLAYDPVERRVFVSDETGGIESVLTASGRRVGTVRLGGEAGNVQYDAGARRILVDVQTQDVVAVVDPRRARVVRRIPLPGCVHDHGLLVDSPRRVAFVACDGNARLLTLDLRTLRVVGSTTVGSAPDVLALDTSLHRLYVASESGVVSVFDERGRGVAKLGEGFLAAEAHAVAVDPRTHLVYFPLQGGPVLRIMRPTTRSAATFPPPGGDALVSTSPGTQLPAGSWRQLVSRASSVEADAQAVLDTPHALAFTLTAAPAQTLRVFWSVYCEGAADDEILTKQASTSLTAPVVAVPPMLANAYKCVLTLRVRPTAGGTARATIYGY